ncbi:hypothetical protein BDR05DRAFT_161573 [Suillus weaverae]|nr:hypothetical protein BDR05DRAFT_161573 [Suillus weaverae]
MVTAWTPIIIGLWWQLAPTTVRSNSPQKLPLRIGQCPPSTVVCDCHSQDKRTGLHVNGRVCPSLYNKNTFRLLIVPIVCHARYGNASLSITSLTVLVHLMDEPRDTSARGSQDSLRHGRTGLPDTRSSLSAILDLGHSHFISESSTPR